MNKNRKNCALLGYYAASSGNFLPMLWENLSVPSSRINNPKRKPVALAQVSHRQECGR